MTTVDLSRIPEVYRERVQREMSQAHQSAAEAADEAHPPWTCQEAATNANLAAGERAAQTVLARYLAIADKADLVAAIVPPYEGTKEDVEQARLDARAKVWADELAKLDVAVERQADPVADMRAEADASRDPLAARMMRMTADVWEKAAKGADEGPLCEWGLCREPLSSPPRDGCGARDLHASGSAADAVRTAQRAHLDAATEELSRRAQVAARKAAQAGLNGTVQTEARLDIGDAAGLRMALDGVARYLVGKPRETIGALVALLKTLPLGYAPKIDLGGCDEGAAALAIVAALPGAYTGATARDNGAPLYYAHAEVDGVEVAARHAPTPPRSTIPGPAGLDVAARAGGDR